MELGTIYQHSSFADLAYVLWNDSFYDDPARSAVEADKAERIPKPLGEQIFISAGWSIANHHPNDASGLSATVFANGTEKVLAIRGTEPNDALDIYQDLLQDRKSVV